MIIQLSGENSTSVRVPVVFLSKKLSSATGTDLNMINICISSVTVTLKLICRKYTEPMAFLLLNCRTTFHKQHLQQWTKQQVNVANLIRASSYSTLAVPN